MLQRLDQHRAATLLHVLIMLAAFLVIVSMLIQRQLDPIILTSSTAGIVLVGLSLFLHSKRWSYAPDALLIIIVALVGFATNEPFLTEIVSLPVILPAAIAALVSKSRLPILWSTVLMLGVLIARASGHGVYTEPETLIIIFLIVGCIFLTRVVLETTGEAHRTAERQRQLAETYLQGIGDAVIAIDRDWHITLFNPAAEQITGWQRNEVIGRRLRDVIKFVKVNDRSENMVFIESAMVEGKVGALSGNTVLITKDGREVPVGDSAAPLIDEVSGQIKGAIIVFRDMTAEKAAATLGSEFAYAQHQMRTPLGTAIVTLQSTEELDDINQVKQQVSASMPQLKSVRQMVEESLELLKVEHEPTPPQPAKTNLAAIIKESVEAAKADFGASIWDVNLPAGEVTVNTDADLLKKALLIVLNNAGLYNTASQPIRVSLESADRHTITVANSGTIPEAEQALVFNKFFRGSNKPPLSSGAGLGLYLAKQYLSRIGGKIWFSSSVKDGTRFFISLPI